MKQSKKQSKKEIKKKIKDILKKQKASVTMPNIKRENKWEKENGFFKSEMEETKKSMFLR